MRGYRASLSCCIAVADDDRFNIYLAWRAVDTRYVLSAFKILIKEQTGEESHAGHVVWEAVETERVSVELRG